MKNKASDGESEALFFLEFHRLGDVALRRFGKRNLARIDDALEILGIDDDGRIATAGIEGDLFVPRE